MRALIMAGGAGSRLGRGEKPLTLVCDRPMISYIIDAFRSAGCEPIVAISEKTPMTSNWCRAHDTTVVRTGGHGYIEDMITAIRHLDEDRALFVSVSDIPCITPEIIVTMEKSYHTCKKDALSAWVPASRVKSCKGEIIYSKTINGIDSCPAGINILRGGAVGQEQGEFALLLDDPRLAMNVNTPEDLARTEAFLTAQNACRTRRDDGPIIPIL